MEQTMPYKKIIMTALLNFIHDRGVQVNMVLFGITYGPFIEWVKVYALLIGAIYTTCMLYKNVIREFRWWKAFEKAIANNYMLVKAMIYVRKQKNEHDKENEK